MVTAMLLQGLLTVANLSHTQQTFLEKLPVLLSWWNLSFKDLHALLAIDRSWTLSGNVIVPMATRTRKRNLDFMANPCGATRNDSTKDRTKAHAFSCSTEGPLVTDTIRDAILSNTTPKDACHLQCLAPEQGRMQLELPVNNKTNTFIVFSKVKDLELTNVICCKMNIGKFYGHSLMFFVPSHRIFQSG